MDYFFQNTNTTSERRMIRPAIIFIIFGIHLINADKCGHYATLVEKQRFILTQPYNGNLSVNFEDFFRTFENISTVLPEFRAKLEQYSSVEKIMETEPQPLIPFEDKTNLFFIKDNVTTFSASEECNKNKGQLVSVNQQNRAQIAAILKSLNATSTPFLGFAYQDSVYSPLQMDFLDKPASSDAISAVHTKGTPVLFSNNRINYPVKMKVLTTTTAPSGRRKRQTTSAPATIETTKEDFTSPVLCAKPNNPWDLLPNRASWLKTYNTLTSKIRQLEKLLFDADTIKRVLGSFPKAVNDVASHALRLQTPAFLKDIATTLRKFTTSSAWDSSTMATMNEFTKLIFDIKGAIRFFKNRSGNIFQLTSTNKKFIHPFPDETTWLSHINLNDESSYGMRGPVSIQLKEMETREKGTSSLDFKAMVSFDIYHHHNDEAVIYAVKPNIINGAITDVTHVVTTASKTYATTSEPFPSNCGTITIREELEPLQICKQVQTPSMSRDLHQHQLALCGQALQSAAATPIFSNCPTITAPATPYAYRAFCQPFEQTAIVNSIKPLSLVFICDTQTELPREYSSFPVQIKTACEIQESSTSGQQVLLPQLNADYYQDPTINEISTSPPEKETILKKDNIIIILISLATITLTVVIIICSIFILFKPERAMKLFCFFCKRKKKTEELPPTPATLEMAPVSRQASQLSIHTAGAYPLPGQLQRRGSTSSMYRV